MHRITGMEAKIAYFQSISHKSDSKTTYMTDSVESTIKQLCVYNNSAVTSLYHL